MRYTALAQYLQERKKKKKNIQKNKYDIIIGQLTKHLNTRWKRSVCA